MHNPSLFEGNWNVVEATVPGGAPGYSGTITIRRLEAVFLLDWDITAGRYVGIGLPVGDHLLVSCGEQFAGLGLALYRRVEDGMFAGWWTAAESGGATGSSRLAPEEKDSFIGQHHLVETLPDGRNYGAWTLAVERIGSVYTLAWRKGDMVHRRGVGLDTGEGIAVGWYPDIAQLALLDYTCDPQQPNRLRASWALGGLSEVGTEYLVRHL